MVRAKEIDLLDKNISFVIFILDIRSNIDVFYLDTSVITYLYKYRYLKKKKTKLKEKIYCYFLYVHK